MDKRTEYESVTKQPGKFEGEAAYSPYFYEKIMEGASDDELIMSDDRTISVFFVAPEDIAIFPELAGVEAIQCIEDDNGFFYTSEITRKEWENYVAEQSDAQEGSED
jgi:hypothetical protein